MSTVVGLVARLRRTASIGTLIAIGAIPLLAGVQAQSSSASRTVSIQKLRDNLYLLTAGGVNSAALVTDLGVVLVDTNTAEWTRPVLDKLKTVTTRPVTTIINTHAHAESYGGNELFPTSVEIVAHDTTRTNMDRMPEFSGTRVNFLPKLMFKEKTTVGTGKDRIELQYFGPAHTGGDAWIVFPALRVMHTGDLLLSKQPPIVDFDNGGSALAYPATLARALERLKDVDTIIPSRGPLLTVRDLQEYVQYTQAFRDFAVSGVNHGLSISDVAASWKPAERFAAYAPMPERINTNARVIFSELTR